MGAYSFNNNDALDVPNYGLEKGFITLSFTINQITYITNWTHRLCTCGYKWNYWFMEVNDSTKNFCFKQNFLYKCDHNAKWMCECDGTSSEIAVQYNLSMKKALIQSEKNLKRIINLSSRFSENFSKEL